MTHRRYHQSCFAASPIMIDSLHHIQKEHQRKKATKNKNKNSINSLTKSNSLINKFVLAYVNALLNEMLLLLAVRVMHYAMHHKDVVNTLKLVSIKFLCKYLNSRSTSHHLLDS